MTIDFSYLHTAQQCINNLFCYGGSHEVRDLTKFDYLFIWKSKKQITIGAQNEKQYDVSVDCKTYTLNKDSFIYIEEYFSSEEFEALQKDEIALGRKLMGMIDTLSIKASKQLPSVFDIIDFIPIFYRDSFGTTAGLNYQKMDIIDPVAGFPLEIKVIYDEKIAVRISLNVDYIKPN